jgi:hypothetical protein
MARSTHIRTAAIGIALAVTLLVAAGALYMRGRPVARGQANASDPATSPTPVARHVLIITIDTLRADRIGAYGWQEARRPSTASPSVAPASPGRSLPRPSR